MNIIPVKAEALPARAAKAPVANAFAAAVSAGGFKVLSIKSKVFTLVDGETRTLIKKEDDDAPSSNVEVVIVASNPHKSKVYYAGGYVEGATDKPLCYSNNGLSPEADAQEPQAIKCATCAHNQIGSKISENGKKVKACSDSLRLALIPADLKGDPMLLRVPATSLKLLGQYGAYLADKNYEPHQVVTRIGFDYTVAYPALTFKVIGIIEEGSDGEARIEELRKSDLVQQIIGTMPITAEGSEDEQFVLPSKPVAKVAVEEAPKKAAPKAAAPKVAPAEDLPAEPAKKVKVEAKPVAEEVAEMVDSSDDLEFDD